MARSLARLLAALLSALGLLATVASLRAYWHLLDLLLPPRPLLPALLLPGPPAALGLALLGTASSLHSGVSPSFAPGALWPCWLATNWLVQEEPTEAEGEDEAFMGF
jgi:hypothetical protein